MEKYTKMLKEELLVALGCTEPIAVAYACAKARAVLEEMPDNIIVRCSGNIIKNVKGVIVPGTDNMKGIETSAILGTIIGRPELELEILTEVKDEDITLLKQLLGQNICNVELAEDVSNLFIEVTMQKGTQTSVVEIVESHNNITKVAKNGEIIYENDTCCNDDIAQARDFINMNDIYEYVNNIDYSILKELLSQQINYNVAIAKEGLDNQYGANVGKTIDKCEDASTLCKAKALTSSGSDARMGGCVLPVVINSGSGNQGITVSVPVYVYGQELGVSEEKIYRAVALSNLVSIYIKTGIGKLSAFCGAVSAACGAGAGVAYLHGANEKVINDTITNTLANTGGIICDGAKSSCAAKIASSLDSAIMSYNMAKNGNVFQANDGLVENSIDDTIKNFCRMAKIGMKSTDVEILNIMIGK